MTHLQEIFIQNLRFLRKKRGISQLKLSEMLNISPNYLNAVENGKNFPSPDVIQLMCDSLGVLPYQLFLEHPAEAAAPHSNTMISELAGMKQRLIKEINDTVQKCEKEKA